MDTPIDNEIVEIVANEVVANAEVGTTNVIPPLKPELVEQAINKFKARFPIKNSKYYDAGKLDAIIGEIERLTASNKRTSNELKKIRKYEVVEIGGRKRLINKLKQEKSGRRHFYGTIEETLEAIHHEHFRLGHAGQNKLHQVCKGSWETATEDLVNWYVERCEICQAKLRQLTRPIVVKPVRSHRPGGRGQVDLMDYQAIAYNSYRWVLHYQDHFSKLSMIRPLSNKQAISVARELLDIFCIIGAPAILQSDNGREFTADVIRSIALLWPDMKIVNGKARHPQSQGTVERANQDVIKVEVVGANARLKAKSATAAVTPSQKNAKTIVLNFDFNLNPLSPI